MVRWSSKPGRTAIGINSSVRKEIQPTPTLSTPTYSPPATEAPTVIGKPDTSSNTLTPSAFSVSGDFELQEDTVSGVKILKVVYSPDSSIIHVYQPLTA